VILRDASHTLSLRSARFRARHPAVEAELALLIDVLLCGYLLGIRRGWLGEKSGQGIPKSVVTDGPVVTKANASKFKPEY